MDIIEVNHPDIGQGYQIPRVDIEHRLYFNGCFTIIVTFDPRDFFTPIMFYSSIDCAQITMNMNTLDIISNAQLVQLRKSHHKILLYFKNTKLSL